MKEQNNHHQKWDSKTNFKNKNKVSFFQYPYKNFTELWLCYFVKQAQDCFILYITIKENDIYLENGEY